MNKQKQNEIEKEIDKGIIEFINSNIENKTKIAFLFDDKKTGKKNYKVYLGRILQIAKEQGKASKEKEMLDNEIEFLEEFNGKELEVFSDITKRIKELKFKLIKLKQKLKEIKNNES